MDLLRICMCSTALMCFLMLHFGKAAENDYYDDGDVNGNGTQAASLNNNKDDDDGNGTQAALLNKGDDGNGTQAALLNKGDDGNGTQAALLLNKGDDGNGTQAALLLNKGDDGNGTQAAVLLNKDDGDGNGTEAAVLNKNDDDGNGTKAASLNKGDDDGNGTKAALLNKGDDDGNGTQAALLNKGDGDGNGTKAALLNKGDDDGNGTKAALLNKGDGNGTKAALLNKGDDDGNGTQAALLNKGDDDGNGTQAALLNKGDEVKMTMKVLTTIAIDVPRTLNVSLCAIRVGSGSNEVINLKPLGMQGYPRYNATIQENQSSWIYLYDPCMPYSLTYDNSHNKDVPVDGCHSVFICIYKNESSRSPYYSLSINSTDIVKVEVIALTNQTADASVMLVYTGTGSFKTVEIKVLLVCDKTRKGVNDGFFNITSVIGNSSVSAELHHECCCAGGCWKQGLGAEAVDTIKSDGEMVLVVAGFLVGLMMLVALIGGLCYVRRTHLHFYAKLPGVNPVDQNTNSTAMTLLANPKEGPSYPDFRDYEPAGLSNSKRKLIPVLADSNIQIHTVEMGQRLGGGVFGDTHMARWSEMTVTLKRLTLAIHNNQLTSDTMDWMKEEVWFLSRQRHKNIVCVIGLCLEGRLPFLLTEYVVGECVKDFLKGNGKLLTWPQRIRMCNQVADGMTFLHSTKPPIIHRDLRCGNLFLSDNDLVKVADFGLIKLLQPMREQCQNDDCSCQRQMSACPARMRWTAPELLTHPRSKEGQSSVITPACDVYSFGLVMWEMVVCKDPFDEIVTETEVINIVRNGGRPDVPSSVDMMPQYRDLMKTCWAQRPTLRPHFKQIAVKLKDLVVAARSHQKQINTNKQRLQKLQNHGLE